MESCQLCLDKTVKVLFYPCCHFIACFRCSNLTTRCPLCKENISARIKYPVEKQCLLCNVNSIDTIFLPCFHLKACQGCAKKLVKCCSCEVILTEKQVIYVANGVNVKQESGSENGSEKTTKKDSEVPRQLGVKRQRLSESTIKIPGNKTSQIPTASTIDLTSSSPSETSDSSDIAIIADVSVRPATTSIAAEIIKEESSDSSDFDAPLSGIYEKTFYNGDPKLPVLKWGLTQGMATKEVVSILLGLGPNDSHKICSAIPCKIERNTAFLVDCWELSDPWDIKCDDMGSWVNNGRRNFRKGSISDEYDVYRQFYTNASLPSLKKSLITLEKDGKVFRYMFVQYMFTERETTLILKPHGNSKGSSRQNVYQRTMTSTSTMVKVKQEKPREIMHSIIDERGGIDSVRSSGEYPRDRMQIYNARRSSNLAKVNAYSPHDPIVQLLEMSKQQQRGDKAEWFVRDVQLSDEQTIFLSNDQQLLDVERFCTNPEGFSVFSVDATFNVAKHYFTFGTYRNLMLETKDGSNPICIGPGVLHKRKLESSYYTLPSSMVKYRPETRGVLVIGTDGEENIANALSSVFIDAAHLRCEIHLRDNVKRKLSMLGVSNEASSAITKDIFGCSLEGGREGGFVDCASQEEFEDALEEIRRRWLPLDPKASSFLEYFVQEAAPVIRDSMRADIRAMCGLGFPPVSYSQNASECLNRYVKEDAKGSRDVTRSLLDAVNNISLVVKRQFDEHFLAVLAKGSYRLAKEFRFLQVEEGSYYRMSSRQKENLKKRFFNASMSDSRRRNGDNGSDDGESIQRVPLSVEPEESQIISVPFATLESSFSKAKDLLGKTWKIHGTDNLWMVPSTSNPKSPHMVKVYLNNRIDCDKECANHTAYGLCSHSIAVAEEENILGKFLAWHKKNKRSTNLTHLSNVGLPASSGKKGVKATQRRKGKPNKPTVTTSCAPVTSRVVKPARPAKPSPSFGTFIVSNLNFLDPKVSVCYGCRQSLKPMGQIPSSPDDLVVASKARRSYFKDGGMVTSPEFSNVYYHLNPNCVSQKNAFFLPGLVQVPQDLKPHLDVNHVAALRDRLNVH